MELRQLEYFVAVAEELHFSRAAERLHVAQPSVSEQVRSLERELGLALFERSSRSVVLTPAGRDILPLAQELLSDARELLQQALQSARRLTGRMRIGFLADEYATPVGEALIAAVRRQHPRLEVEFEQVDFADHHRALEDGRVDVAFVMGPVPDSLVSVELGRSARLVAVSRAALEVEGQAVVLPNQMTSHAWRSDWTPPGSPSGQVFVVGENRMEAMLAAVGARRGVAVVAEYVSRYYPQPGVTFRDVPGLGSCSVELAALRSRQAEPDVAAFLAIARALVADLAKAPGFGKSDIAKAPGFGKVVACSRLTRSTS